MTEKRFVDNGFEAIEDQSFTDTKTDKTYYVDYFDEIIDLVNQLNGENEQLKQSLKNKMESDTYWEVKANEIINEHNNRIRELESELKDYQDANARLEEQNEELKKELKELNKKYIAFSEATDKRLKELYGGKID